MADSNLDQRSSDLEEDPVALLASGARDRARHRHAARPAVRGSRGPGRDGASVVLLASPLRAAAPDRQRRAPPAPDRGRGLDVLRCRSSATPARASLRAGCGGSSRRPSGSPPGTSRSRSSTRAATRSASWRAASSACACGSRGSTAPVGSSSPTPPTSCARRSSRSAASSSCSRSRSSTPATREEFLASMREQVARLAKLATDLLDLSRLDAGRLTPVSETVDLAGLAAELTAEFTPRARGHRARARLRVRRARSRRAATPSGSSRSAGSWSRTRSSTRRPGPRCGWPPRSTGTARSSRSPTTAPASRRGAPAGVRALLPARRRPRLRQRPRAGDRARARGGDGRADRAVRSAAAGPGSRSRCRPSCRSRKT